MTLQILIATPSTKWSAELKDHFTHQGHEVDVVYNGKDCQLKAYKKKYTSILIDFSIKDHSALQVLKYLKGTSTDSTVVIKFDKTNFIEDKDYTEMCLKKLGASFFIEETTPVEDIVKSLEGTNQFDSWKKLKSFHDSKEEVITNDNDSSFTQIKIQDFYSEEITVFDCYLKLERNRYVKTLHRGDYFDRDRLKKYITEYNNEFIYFKTTDRPIYINYMNENLSKVLSSKQESSLKKLSYIKNLIEQYLIEVYQSGFTPYLVDEGKKVCANLTLFIQNEKDVTKLIDVVNSFEKNEHSHAFKVAFFSVIICRNLHWASARSTEVTAFASLFHDIGLLKLPTSIRLKSLEEMTPDELVQYYEHPRLGNEMLQAYPEITEAVRQIVYQHHENITGDGYPNRLPGSKIYPLAKVVSLASAYSHVIERETKSTREGLTDFIQERNEIIKFDPDCVRALIQSFIKEKVCKAA